MSIPLNVLMIEDRESDALLILRALQRAGYEPRHLRVETPSQLHRAMKDRSWEVVLTDYSLPQFSGLDSLKIVRQWDADVPFIIVSGVIGEETAVATMKAGADDYVLKDNLARLGLIIQRELRDAEARRARREAERELILREALFRSLIENVADMVVILDDWAAVRYQSPSVERVLGYNPDEAAGTKGLACLHPDERDKAYDILFSRIRQQRQIPDLECRVRHRDGSWRILEGTVTNLLDDPAVNGIVCNFRDTTERKHLEKQLVHAQRMEGVGNLAGGIAHDLNNLLTPVLVASELLAEDLSDADRDALVETLRSGANRAVEIVEQLLALARGIRADQTEAQVAEVMRDTERLLRYGFPSSIEIEMEISDSLWAVSIDATQLGQVLMNLCVNARDAMPNGGRLTIDAQNISIRQGEADEHAASPGDYVRLSVSDTGGGIPQEIRERIFDPFFTTKEPGRGTGLGLWIVTRVVDEAGGFCNLNSSPTGTRFSVFLPASSELPTPTRPKTPPERDETRKVPSTELQMKGRVLIAEGEASLRQIIKETLEMYGCETLTAADGAEAVAVYRENLGRVELAVIDMDLAVLNVRDAIAAITEHDPHARILLQHRAATDPGKLKDLKPHVHALLEKPYTTGELISRVREAVQAD